jgi:5-methylcytosine-specific restriction endonuclease McrA
MRKSTVAYHARRLGEPARDDFARRYDWKAIRSDYEAGMTMGELQERYGFCAASWTQAVRRGDIIPRPRARDINSLLVRGHSRNGRCNRKKRLIDAGIKEDKCERCGISEWCGKKLSIQLHHRNGDGTDNRLWNLEMLCPNCHSLTDTFGGRNGHRRRKPPLTLF